MVKRYESPELRRQAQAHEDQCARQGIVSRCTCLVGSAVTIAGLAAPLLSLDQLLVSTTPVVIPEADLARARGDVGRSDSAWRSDFASAGRPDPFPTLRDEAPRHAGIDGSLLVLCAVALAICACSRCQPQTEPPWPPGAMGTGPMQSRMMPPGGGGMFSGMLGRAQQIGVQAGLDPQHAIPRVVDMKPGEMCQGPGYLGMGGYQGAQAGGVNGQWGGAFGGAGWNQAGFQGQNAQWLGAYDRGAGLASWLNPVPSQYSDPMAVGNQMGGRQQGFGFGNAVGAASALPGGYGSGMFGAMGIGAAYAGRGPPTEAEVSETYAAVGLELQQWVPALQALIEQQILELVLQGLQSNDQILVPSLNQAGWQLTAERPVSRQSALGSAPRELSVFDRNLPQPLCNDQRAVELWRQRQWLENYLSHPSFDHTQRPFVLERIREWRQRGLRSAMRFDQRALETCPTDAHIIENIVMKTLDTHLDFTSCFTAVANHPPRSKFQGQPPAAFLRQVTDQSIFPKPPPHYEVVTPTKVWKLRQGNQNLLEALALLLDAHRRHSKSFQSFPQSLRAIVDPQLQGTPGTGFASALGWAAGNLPNAARNFFSSFM